MMVPKISPNPQPTPNYDGFFLGGSSRPICAGLGLLGGAPQSGAYTKPGSQGGMGVSTVCAALEVYVSIHVYMLYIRKHRMGTEITYHITILEGP